MGNIGRVQSVILWTARVIDSVLLVFVLIFLMAHIFGKDESGEGFSNSGEIIQFICFPVGLVAGLLIAWRWEGVGGLVSTLSMTTLFVMRSELVGNPYMIIMIIPGLLFLLYWFLHNVVSDKGQSPISP